MFHQGAQAVAVGGDQYAFAADNGGGDFVFPERQYAFERDFQVFAVGNDIGGQVRVTAVVMRGERVFRVEQRRQGVVAAPPDMNLFVAVFFRRSVFCPALAVGRSGVRSAARF